MIRHFPFQESVSNVVPTIAPASIVERVFVDCFAVAIVFRTEVVVNVAGLLYLVVADAVVIFREF